MRTFGLDTTWSQSYRVTFGSAKLIAIGLLISCFISSVVKSEALEPATKPMQLAQSEAFKDKKCLEQAKKSTQETCMDRLVYSFPLHGVDSFKNKPESERREALQACHEHLLPTEAGLLGCRGYKLDKNWKLK